MEGIYLNGLSSLLDRVMVAVDLSPLGLTEGMLLGGGAQGGLVASVRLGEGEAGALLDRTDGNLPRGPSSTACSAPSGSAADPVVADGAGLIGTRRRLTCELLGFHIELWCRVTGVREGPRAGASRRAHIELAVEGVHL